MKNNKLSKYNEFIVFILQMITGNKTPTLCFSVIESIKSKFIQVITAFNQIKHNRLNLLNYNFILNKIFGILKLKEFISYFPTLKQRTILLNHEHIRSEICKILNWKY